MAEAGVQQGVFAAKDLEAHVPGAADELRRLGDVAAGVLHAHDVGHVVGQLVHQPGAEGIAHPAGVVVEQHRRFGDAFSDGLKVVVQLVVGGFEEHGLQDADGGRAVLDGHTGQAAALSGADGADAKVDRHPAGGLIHHDLQAALHFVLFHHVELAVGTKRQNAADPAFNDIVHLGALAGLVDPLVFVNDGQDGDHDAFHKIGLHCFVLLSRAAQRPISMPVRYS